ncbi:MAG: 2-hydroxyacyl-CoA dehydratase, partial [Planctomycetes bacterium]|nr:2-hydroxyacyl-CoA dehydratase [Planctomycetota bacterium]
ELRRAVPCPHGYKIGAQIWTMVTMLWPGDPRCTAWLEELVTETEQRVQEGIGAVPAEKIRLFWYDLRPFWVYEFAPWLEKEWGAVVIMDMITYNPYTLIDTSTEETMLRGLAKRSLSDALMVRQERGPANIVATDITRVVKDYKIDCVVWPAHMGHKAKAGVVGIGRQVCRELNVPFLYIDLDIFDPQYTSSDEIKDQMSKFFTAMGLG